MELAEAISSHESNIRYDDIQGVLFKRNGVIIKNKNRALISDLDILALPKREYFGMGKYYGSVNILTGRGCPGKCIYCAAPSMFGSKYRTRSIENVFLEIVLLKVCIGESLTKVDRLYLIGQTNSEQ
ncbi:MAG: hypothetical protein GX992_02675 [Clostridium sp.]|nr:hypothetical protein [Clostridium sp.]